MPKLTSQFGTNLYEIPDSTFMYACSEHTKSTGFMYLMKLV